MKHFKNRHNQIRLWLWGIILIGSFIILSTTATWAQSVPLAVKSFNIKVTMVSPFLSQIKVQKYPCASSHTNPNPCPEQPVKSNIVSCLTSSKSPAKSCTIESLNTLGSIPHGLRYLVTIVFYDNGNPLTPMMAEVSLWYDPSDSTISTMKNYKNDGVTTIYQSITDPITLKFKPPE